MKKYILYLFLTLLMGCNSLRCEFVHPDNMSPALFKLCMTEASSTDALIIR